MFKIANSQYFFVKISWSGPWISRIHWCKGHWYGSTYIAVRLSDISSKMAKKHKKCIFGLFLSLCRTASRPYRLSHTNALRINEFYSPKDRCMKFSQKNIENWRFWKMTFFWVGHFEFHFFKKNFFFPSSQQKLAHIYRIARIF